VKSRASAFTCCCYDRAIWLKDRYGLSWQIVPAALGQMLGDPDPTKAQNVMQAMLQMRKRDAAALRRACEQA
jgi:predicted 3-demethylubiquinone-9 3-methyltransferase (glyoxalase superfamily)